MNLRKNKTYSFISKIVFTRFNILKCISFCTYACEHVYVCGLNDNNISELILSFPRE